MKLWEVFPSYLKSSLEETYLVRKCFDLDTVKVMIKFFLIFFSSWNYHYQYLIYSTVCSEQKLLKKLVTFFCLSTSTLESVQYFLIKLGIKPLIHLLEISIFSLNDDIVRLTKIMNNLVKDLKILSFKVIFQCLKLV